MLRGLIQVTPAGLPLAALPTRFLRVVCLRMGDWLVGLTRPPFKAVRRLVVGKGTALLVWNLGMSASVGMCLVVAVLELLRMSVIWLVRVIRASFVAARIDSMFIRSLKHSFLNVLYMTFGLSSDIYRIESLYL